MKCFICNDKKVFKKDNKYLCEKCFLRLFDKKVRRWIRQNKVISKGDIIFAKGEVTRHILNNIFKDGQIKIISKKSKLKDLKEIVEKSSDDYICDFMKDLISGKRPKSYKKEVSLLRQFSDDDILLYAKINRLKFNPKKKDKKICDIVENITKGHTGSKVNMLRNIDKIWEITK